MDMGTTKPDKLQAVAAPLSETATYARPAAIEDATNRYVIHPLSSRVARIAIDRGISADALSVIGLLFGLFGSLFYLFLPNPAFVLVAFAAMVCWHVMDGADGRVARATGTSTAFGRVVDGLCDHLVFAAVYVALTLHMIATGTSAWVWVLAVAAAVSHAFQAAAYEERRQKYQRRRKGTPHDAAHTDLVQINGRKSLLAAIYDRGQKCVVGPASGLDSALAALQKDPASRPRAMALVDRTVPLVRLWSILNANNRTIVIAVFALANKPAWYFVYEFLVLNVVLAVLMFIEFRYENAWAQRAAAPHGEAV